MGKNKWIFSLIALAVLGYFSMVYGQTVETTETVEKADSLLSLLSKGGMVMIPLALCSVMAVTLTMERFISLGRKSILPAELEDKLEEHLDKNGSKQLEGAVQICSEHPSPLASVYSTALEYWDHEVNDADKAIGDVASLSIRKLRRSIRPLRLIGSVSPLLGLLGTVVGMIRSFQTVALSSQSINKAELLAEGIYQAMVTTATGLSIAIPTLIVYFYFNNRIDKISEEIEEKGNRFLFKHFRSRFKLES